MKMWKDWKLDRSKELTSAFKINVRWFGIKEKLEYRGKWILSTYSYFYMNWKSNCSRLHLSSIFYQDVKLSLCLLFCYIFRIMTHQSIYHTSVIFIYNYPKSWYFLWIIRNITVWSYQRLHCNHLHTVYTLMKHHRA